MWRGSRSLILPQSSMDSLRFGFSSQVCERIGILGWTTSSVLSGQSNDIKVYSVRNAIPWTIYLLNIISSNDMLRKRSMLQPKRRSTLDHQKKYGFLIRQQGMIKTNQCYAKVFKYR